MAGEFVRRWLGKPPALAPEVREALDELRRLAETQPTLASAARLFLDLLPHLFEMLAREAPPALNQEQASAQLVAGMPLLRGGTLVLDEPAFRRRWGHVCAAVQQRRADDAGRQLAEALRAGLLQPEEMLRSVLNGRSEEVFARADHLGLDAALMGTVLRLTLFPALAHLGVILAPLRVGIPWERGYCPTCGGRPLLGEFRGLESTRFLRCELCATAWEFPRLACPFCGTRDHHHLGYLHVEGEESSRRAAICDACHGYVKMVATLAELSGPRLLVADLATTHLDLAAADRGYTGQP